MLLTQFERYLITKHPETLVASGCLLRLETLKFRREVCRKNSIYLRQFCDYLVSLIPNYATSNAR